MGEFKVPGMDDFRVPYHRFHVRSISKKEKKRKSLAKSAKKRLKGRLCWETDVYFA